MKLKHLSRIEKTIRIILVVVAPAILYRMSYPWPDCTPLQLGG